MAMKHVNVVKITAKFAIDPSNLESISAVAKKVQDLKAALKELGAAEPIELSSVVKTERGE